MSSTCRYIALAPTGSSAAETNEHDVLFEDHESKFEDGIDPKSHTTTSTLTNLYQRNIGLLLVVAAQAFYSIMSFAVKQLSGMDPPVPVLELIGMRMAFTYVCSVAYMLFAGIPDPFIGPKGVRLLLLFRGVSGFFGVSGLYYSLQYLSLSDAVVLTFLAPMCTIAAGSIFLGETLSSKQAVVGSLSIIGVTLIAKPSFMFGDEVLASGSAAGDSFVPPPGEVTSRQRLAAVGAALIGVLGATGVYISLRAIGKRAHPLHTLVFYALQCAIIAPIGVLVTKTPFVFPARLDSVMMFLLAGIPGFIAQILLAMGLARETAGRGCIGCYTQVIFAMVLEYIFLHTAPSGSSVIGMVVIIASALYVALARGTGGSTKNNQGTSMLKDEEEGAEGGSLLRCGNEGSQYEGHLDRRSWECPK